MSKKYSNHKTSKQTLAKSELRIIAGQWRGRKVSFLPVEGLRPTPSRIRETLFNWINPMITNAHCLDCFAGSGALGFEALSRGAQSVTMIELHRDVIRELKNNRTLLDTTQLTIIQQDALVEIQSEQLFDIVFCDPPFNQGLVKPVLENLEQSNCLNDEAVVYLETEKSLKDLELPQGWKIIKEKIAGDVKYMLIKVSKC